MGCVGLKQAEGSDESLDVGKNLGTRNRALGCMLRKVRRTSQAVANDVFQLLYVRRKCRAYIQKTPSTGFQKGSKGRMVGAAGRLPKTYDYETGSLKIRAAS